MQCIPTVQTPHVFGGIFDDQQQLPVEVGRSILQVFLTERQYEGEVEGCPSIIDPDEERFLLSNALPSTWCFPQGYEEDKAGYCAAFGIHSDPCRPCREGYEWTMLPSDWKKCRLHDESFLCVTDERGRTRMLLYRPKDGDRAQDRTLVIPRFLCLAEEQWILDNATLVLYSACRFEQHGAFAGVLAPEEHLDLRYPQWRSATAYWGLH